MFVASFLCYILLRRGDIFDRTSKGERYDVADVLRAGNPCEPHMSYVIPVGALLGAYLDFPTGLSDGQLSDKGPCG